MKEHTVRSFAEEYRVSLKTARKYLNALVENGKASAVY
jgi:response regulator of citrate/malate metabolism